MNQLLNAGHINQRGVEGREKIRPIRPFIITPSVNLSELAEQHQKDMPTLIHDFVSSLGRDAASCADLMSYLLFTSKYTRDLSEIGYLDASDRIDEIEDFLYSSSGEDAGNGSKTAAAAKRSGSPVKARG